MTDAEKQMVVEKMLEAYYPNASPLIRNENCKHMLAAFTAAGIEALVDALRECAPYAAKYEETYEDNAALGVYFNARAALEQAGLKV